MTDDIPAIKFCGDGQTAELLAIMREAENQVREWCGTREVSEDEAGRMLKSRVHYLARRAYFDEITPLLRIKQNLAWMFVTQPALIMARDGSVEFINREPIYPPTVQHQLDELNKMIAEIGLRYGFSPAPG